MPGRRRKTIYRFPRFGSDLICPTVASVLSFPAPATALGARRRGAQQRNPIELGCGSGTWAHPSAGLPPHRWLRPSVGRLTGWRSRTGRDQRFADILPRSRHRPRASTDGSSTRNPNKHGVRLWTACSLDRQRQLRAVPPLVPPVPKGLTSGPVVVLVPGSVISRRSRVIDSAPAERDYRIAECCRGSPSSPI